jgi:hypothetical protein
MAFQVSIVPKCLSDVVAWNCDDGRELDLQEEKCSVKDLKGIIRLSNLKIHIPPISLSNVIVSEAIVSSPVLLAHRMNFHHIPIVNVST